MPDSGTMAMIAKLGINDSEVKECRFHVVVREDNDADDATWIVEEEYFSNEHEARQYGYKQSLRGLHADVYENEYWLGAYE